MTAITTKTYMSGAEPFELAGDPDGVVLLHGFSGSCFEVRELGTVLQRAGYGVIAPALAGHGTHPNDLTAVRADDFFLLAQRAFDQARARFRRVFLVGQSMGGTLALHLASGHHVDGLITIGAPVYMGRPIERGIPFAHRWLPSKNVISNLSAWRGEVVGYRTTPTSALIVFLQVLERVRRDLHLVRAPLLALHSSYDETVPASNAGYILSHVSSRVRRSRLYPAGRHLMTVPPQLEIIQADVLEFLHSREDFDSAASARVSGGAPRD